MVARDPVPGASAPNVPDAAARSGGDRIRRAAAWALGVALALLAVLLLALVALAVFGVSLSVAPLRHPIAHAASLALGREVRLEGPLLLVPGFAPKLVVGGVRVLNPPGFATPDLATLGDASAQLALAPLLEGRLDLLSLEASDARIRLEVAVDGTPNWRFAVVTRKDEVQPPSGPASTHATLGGAVAVNVERLSLAHVQLEYHDAKTGVMRELDLDALEGTGAPGGPLSVSFHGHVEREFPYAGTFRGAPLAELGEGRPWPFELDLALIGASVHLSGTFDPATGRTRATLGLGAENLAEVERFVQTRLPPVGATGLGAQVEVQGRTFTLESIRAVMGASRLEGRLELSLAGARPRVTGLLQVPTLDVRPFLGFAADPDAAERPLTFAELEQVTVDLRELRGWDVALGLRIGRIPGLAGEVRDVQLDVGLEDGLLAAPAAVTIADVRLEGRIGADAREALPGMSLALGARDTPLGGLAELLAGLRGLEGRVGRFDLRLAGRGETVGALARALDVRVAAGDARLTYGNAAAGRPVAMTLADFVARIPPGETLRAEGRGTLLGVPVTLTARGGDLVNVLRDRRTPLELAVRGSGAALTLAGVLGEAYADRGSDVRFAIEARRAGDLARWLGVSPQAAVPVAITGRARVRRDEWHLDETLARLGRSTVTVDAHRTGIGTKQELVVASVRSPLIDVPELESLLPPAAARRHDAPAVVDVPLLPQGIDLADADIGVGVERVVLGRADLVNAAFAARLREGRLPPTPFVATLAEVPFQGTLALDLRKAVPELALALGTDGVDVGALLARLGVADGLDAQAQALRLEVQGRGATLGEALRRSSFRALLEGGALTLRDPARRPLARVALTEGAVGAEPGEPVKARIDGRLEGVPVRIAIQSGTLAELLGNTRFVPFKVDAEAAGTQLNVDGRAALPLRGEGDLTLVLSGERLDSLSGLARADLPPWGPWSLAGPLRLTRDAYELPRLDVRVGETLLEGKGRVVVSGARPRLDVEVKAARFQLDDFPTAGWSAAQGSGARAGRAMTAAEARAQAKDAAQRGQALLSREVLSRFDAFVDVQVAEVRSGDDRLGGGWLRTQVEDGRLTLGPAQVDVPGGTATLSAAYMPLAQGVQVALGAYVDRFDYGVLARRAQPGTDAAGTLSLRLDLASRAPSLDAVMAHANGRIDFAVWPQSIAADVFDLWAVNVFLALLPAVDSAQGSRVNCAVGRFDVRDGKLTEDRLVLDTSRMRVTGTGKVDFDTEVIELRMQPQAKRAQAFNLQTPVEVRGTLEDFTVNVRGEDVAATVVRFFGSALVVPFQRLAQGPLPADGADVCTDPLREPTTFERR